MTIVRDALVADIEGIVTMGLRFISNTGYRGTLSGATRERLRPIVEMSIAMGTCLVAEERCHVARCEDRHAHLVGFLVAVVLENPFTGALFIDEQAWWMEPEHRGGRAAYQMLRRLIDWTRQNGVPTLKMVAPAHAPQLGAFYERMGFRACETSYTLNVLSEGDGDGRPKADPRRDRAAHADR